MNSSTHNDYSLETKGKCYQVKIKKHLLRFNFPAKTSRGSISLKPTYFIEITNLLTNQTGIGECSPLAGLSHEFNSESEYESYLELFATKLAMLDETENVFVLPEIVNFPSICFGIEIAFRDLKTKGEKILFENSFTSGNSTIPINGLVWMGDYEFMLDQMQEKVEKGFTCIKIKIGAIDFKKECTLIKQLRSEFSPQQITIRLDANGAFAPKTALHKLEQLAVFDIHSIEQPIKQGQYDHMAALCKESPIPIALDEELIGVTGKIEKQALLDQIMPQYIILKPSLLGGFRASEKWINLAEKRNIGWWITSALESNIGLNAIAQFTAKYKVDIPQGLGTGQLYHNNIASPLYIEKGRLGFSKLATWDSISF